MKSIKIKETDPWTVVYKGDEDASVTLPSRKNSQYLIMNGSKKGTLFVMGFEIPPFGTESMFHSRKSGWVII